jgi:hypothetical protein
VDNDATHKHPAVQAWLAKHPRMRCTSRQPQPHGSTSSSASSQRSPHNRIRRGVFKGVAELEAAIVAYLAHRNQQPHPFTWTASVESIIEKVERAKETLETLH